MVLQIDCVWPAMTIVTGVVIPRYIALPSRCIALAEHLLHLKNWKQHHTTPRHLSLPFAYTFCVRGTEPNNGGGGGRAGYMRECIVCPGAGVKKGTLTILCRGPPSGGMIPSSLPGQSAAALLLLPSCSSGDTVCGKVTMERSAK